MPKDVDTTTVSAASGLTRKIVDFEFIVTLHVLREILCVDPASRQLQSVICDLKPALIKSIFLHFAARGMKLTVNGSVIWMQRSYSQVTMAHQHPWVHKNSKQEIVRRRTSAR